jgi:hypothetical protein
MRDREVSDPQLTPLPGETVVLDGSYTAAVGFSSLAVVCPHKLRLTELELFSCRQQGLRDHPRGPFVVSGGCVSVDLVAASVSSSSIWTVFWVQLPVLVLALAVVIAATTALWRARPEDVPKVFEAFAAAFGRRPTPRAIRARRTK